MNPHSYIKKRHRAGDVSCYSCSFIHCNKSSYCIFPSAKRNPASTTSSSVTSNGIPFTSKKVSNTYIPIRLFPSTNAWLDTNPTPIRAAFSSLLGNNSFPSKVAYADSNAESNKPKSRMPSEPPVYSTISLCNKSTFS